MIRTHVGYTGGTTENPTYHNLDGHTEAVQIEYDPSRISYQELLDVFWGGHNPTQPAWSRQYASIVFYHDEEQKRLAEASKLELMESGVFDKPIVTFIDTPGAYPGMHAIQEAWQAHQRGEIDHTGVMVHLVPDEGVDDGPVVATEVVPIHADDTLAMLEARVHETEHRLLVQTLHGLLCPS